MANDPRKPTSWKNPGTPGKSGPAPSQKREWHPTTPTARPSGPRRRSVLLPALVGAVLLGLIVAAILMLQPARMPRLIVVAPADTTTLAVPHNLAGANAARGLTAWAEPGRDRPRIAQGQVDSVGPEDWSRGFDDGSEKSVVVYFGMNGGADATGPFLWLVPPEATAPAESHKLRVAALLDRLSKLPDKIHKLLVLDCAHVPVSYAHGQIHNDFARALKAMDAEIARVPNLVVICSADEDQRSWYSEEWQRPIFAHLLVEGAKGAVGEDRVTAERLFEYLKREVPAWTRINRGEEQIPILLPTGDGQKRAAEIEIATVTAKRYSAPSASSAPGSTFTVPAELADAWRRRDELANNVPPPQAVAPVKWRRHLDLLLRAEHLHRYGAPSADVLGLLAQVRAAEAELGGSPWPELTSTPNALPMPAALGAATPATLDAGRFLALFADPINEWPKLRDSIAARGGTASTRLPLDVCRHLIDHLLREDRADNIARATRMLDVVFGPSPAPVEAHIIRILNRDLDDARRKDWAPIKQALILQRMAEETALIGGCTPQEYPASEQVFPWIRDAVAAADTDRLKAFDLLISGSAADWSRAGELMTATTERYRTIQQQAGQIRESMAARNAALAELPYFGRWVAGRRDDANAEEIRQLLERVERAAETAHRLSALLEEANPARINEMHGLAGVANSELNKIRGDFFRFIAKLNADTLVSRWHEIDNALQVPLIPSKRRTELLTNLRIISSALNDKGEEVKGGGSGGASRSAVEFAQRHGRVALALLGSAWVNNADARDASGGVVRLKYDDLKQRFLSPKPNWWESVQEAGIQIGWHWRYLATQVDSLADKAARGQLEPAMRDLARADTLARTADSATRLGAERDAVTAYRRHRLHNFLLDQARRTIAANWAAADEAAAVVGSGAESFADVTATRFLNDAEQLIMLGADKNAAPEDQARLKAAVAPMRKLVPVIRYDLQPDELSKDLTDQQRNFPLRLTLARPTEQPAGYPVLRFLAGGPARSPSAERQVVRDFGDAAKPISVATRDLIVEVDQRSSSGDSGFVAAELWYRGHRTIKKTRVELNREPSSMWVYKPPKLDAAVAFRSGDLRAGAIAILIDWSYSMVNNPQQVNRYDLALGALRQVLKNLPPDTVVSLMQFGEPDATDTGRPPIVLAPRPRNFETNPGDLEDILRELRENQPRGRRSPIARAIVQAATKGLPSDFVGYRAIVVLTDGEDSVDEAAAGNVVHQALADKGIALKMIFFQTQDGPYRQAIAQFRKAEDLDPPAEFLTAANQAQLAAQLNDAMLPRVRVFTNDGQRLGQLPELSKHGLRVTGHGANLVNWSAPLAAGPYSLRTLNSANTPMTLARGDRLLLELYRSGSRAAFRPRLFLPDVFRDYTDRRLHTISTDGQRIHAGLADYRLVQNTRGGYDLDMLVMMERDRTPEEMQVTRPGFTWIEIRTQEGEAKPGGMRARLENELYMPTPAFRVRAYDWPAIPGQQNARLAPCRPAVSVWWSDRVVRNPILLRRDEVLADLAQRKPFKVNDKELRIDSARIEGDYLLLQISQPPGPPVVFAHPEELKEDARFTMEEEHRFYEKSGKYTARFGPLSEAEKKRRFTLALWPMDELKQLATQIDLTPRVAPTVSPPLGQATPQPFVFDR